MIGVATWAEITTGTATETMVQITAPSNHMVRLREISITFKGTNNLGAPIKVELVKQTTAGTASPLTPVVSSRHISGTIQTSAQSVFTVEPTTTDVCRTWLVHPQGGVIYTNPAPHEVLTLPGGERWGLRVVGTIAEAVNCTGYLEFEE